MPSPTASEPGARVGALFDIDGTLLARNSAPLYMSHLRRTGQARRRDVARTLYYLFWYKLGLLDVRRALDASMAWVRGKDEAALVTQLVVREGRFTGEVIEPVCYGRGKVYWAERFAAEHGVELPRSYFYTDSITDLPVLDRVGHPRVVNPDPRLRRLAQRRGWQVLRPRLGEAAGASAALDG